MKIIDKTPFQDEAGQISLVNRAQATLKHGFSWYAEMQAQQKVVAQLNRALEKGYTLFRNTELGGSGISLPLILLGPAGVFVIEVTAAKGFYRARGDEWGTVSNNRFMPASVNLIARTARYAKVLQVFFEKQGAPLSAQVEPILLAADPGLHLDSVRPNIRVFMTDAIERFAAGLLTARPIMNAQQVNEFAERIQNPRSPRKQNQEEQPVVADAFSLRETPPAAARPSRMRSILSAPKSDALIEKGSASGAAAELGFAFEEEPAAAVDSAPVANITPMAARSNRRPARGRILGMTVLQLAILAGIFLCWLLVMALGIRILL